MRILVYPHQLVIGGSQINAIELAAAVRDRGHEVTITAPEGLLQAMIGHLGLDYIPTPSAADFPSARSAVHLVRLARRLRADLIHAYEWRPAIEATFGPNMLLRTPLLVTVLSMQVPNFLPRHAPLIVGTRELLQQPGTGRSVHLLEPPIDTASNRPRDAKVARARWGFREHELVVAVVGRITQELEKQQGILAAIDAIEALAEHWPARFLIVGAGEGLAEVRRKAEAVNARLGRAVVIVPGQMQDPRDAYDAADVVVGMGSSALKGMAFAKPLVVQGTAGFWRLLEPASVSDFFHQGWFGRGGRGARDLLHILERLAADPPLRLALGAYGRSIVETRYSLDRAADTLIDIYRRVATEPVRPVARIPSFARCAARVAKFRAVTWLRASRLEG